MGADLPSADMNPPRAADNLARYRFKRALAEGQARWRVAELETLTERLMAELLARVAQIERLHHRLRCAHDLRWLALRTKRTQADVMALVERLMTLTPAELAAVFAAAERP